VHRVTEQPRDELFLVADLRRAAIRIDPKDARAHSSLGNALNVKGKIDEAIAAHHEAIRLGPDLALVHGNFGRALKAKGELDAAIAAYRESIRLDSRNRTRLARTVLGTLERSEGPRERTMALRLARLAAEPSDPAEPGSVGNAIVFEALAAGYAANGRLPEAVKSGDAPMNYMGNDRSAPDFTVKDRAGRAWRLSDHRGKVVIMNFWTKTCRPCLEEMPSLLDLSERLAERDDVELVAITTDPDWESIRTIFPPQNSLEILFDSDEDDDSLPDVVRETYGTQLFPETWFIDPNGIIRLRVDGPRDWSQPVVEELISAISS